MGVVMECSLSECFYAWEGSPAYLNGKEIRVSDSSQIKDSFVATGFPYYDFSRMENFKDSLEFFMRESHGIRRLGSAATDLYIMLPDDSIYFTNTAFNRGMLQQVHCVTSRR